MLRILRIAQNADARRANDIFMHSAKASAPHLLMLLCDYYDDKSSEKGSLSGYTTTIGVKVSETLTITLAPV
ncbi:unnamed protein product [Cylicocyclus nassatus]|uniref:Uncharacterized protein n=1 Tax=Cylicocyclus nassatus TaxID=53992 RepID=A0AA36HBG0_CYLNA|nr:unnamed protein product [Cylicocyclus nassatus]